MSLALHLTSLVGLALMSAASGYGLTTLAAVLLWKTGRRNTATAEHAPAVTVLKPLCGAEPRLYENLRSFCLQDHPRYQIVFGVRDATDPALAAVKRIVAEFPALQLDVVVNAQQHGSNRKVSNLINMLPHARHDVLVIADSDALVAADHLRTVVAPLQRRHVGLVTCAYKSMPVANRWAALGAMYVNEWYIPSVLLAWLFGHRGFASGTTLCMTRNTLDAIGGLKPIANHLADDYELGERVRRAGLKIVLSRQVPETVCGEQTLEEVVDHEVRWMRTIRVLRPGSFRFLFVSFNLPLAATGLAISLTAQVSIPLRATLFAASLFTRAILHAVSRSTTRQSSVREYLLIPVRDALLCFVWLKALCTSRITWRGAHFDVDAEGIMRTPI